nr:MAG TPA: hypothetical protein [Caudoviricetes sp.]
MAGRSLDLSTMSREGGRHSVISADRLDTPVSVNQKK